MEMGQEKTFAKGT